METQEKQLATKPQEEGLNALIKFGEKEIDLIQKTKCPDSTPEEFALFLYDCKSRGLNPLKNEVYFVKRSVYDSKSGKSVGKASHQVGIDGFRIIALRSGEYRGQEPVEYGEDIEFGGITVPEYADVGVMRKGFDMPLRARAYFCEYAQTFKKNNVDVLGAMWKKMPRQMLAKCAEALALRKAFPDYLSGLYTTDEMLQAGEEVKPEKPQVKPVKSKIDKKDAIETKEVDVPVSNTSRNAALKTWDSVYSLLQIKDPVTYLEDGSSGIRKSTILKVFNKNDVEDLTEAEAIKFIRQLKNKQTSLEAELPQDKVAEQIFGAKVENSESSVDEEVAL